MYLRTLIFLQFVVRCSSYGMGAPIGACVSLFPEGHGIDAQTTTPPYTITVSKNTYIPGEIIEVVVNTTDMYPEIAFLEGFMIQVRSADCSHLQTVENAMGSFTIDTNDTFLNTLTCQGADKDNTIVHKSHEHVVSKTFQWKAPAAAVGHVYIRGTIARRQKTFWTTVKSEIIKDTSASGAGEYCPVQTKQAVVAGDCPTSTAAGAFVPFALLFNIVTAMVVNSL